MCRSSYKTSIILDAMKTGRDWPVMSAIRTQPHSQCAPLLSSRQVVIHLLVPVTFEGPKCLGSVVDLGGIPDGCPVDFIDPLAAKHENRTVVQQHSPGTSIALVIQFSDRTEFSVTNGTGGLQNYLWTCIPLVEDRMKKENERQFPFV
jgi:hypothetical protein